MKRWQKTLIVMVATLGVLTLLAFAWWITGVLYFFGTGMCSAPDCGPEARELARDLEVWWRLGAFVVLTLHTFVSLVWIFGRRVPPRTRNAPRS